MARRNAWLTLGVEDEEPAEAVSVSAEAGNKVEAEEVVEGEAIVLFEPAPLATPLQAAGRAADEAAARGLFAEYQERLAPHTRRRQAADLACSAAYLKPRTRFPTASRPPTHSPGPHSGRVGCRRLCA